MTPLGSEPPSTARLVTLASTPVRHETVEHHNSYEMTNGEVTVTWGPRDGHWQLLSISTARGGQSFQDQPLFEAVHRPDGVSEFVFPVLAASRKAGLAEKLAFPFGGGAIRNDPATSVSDLFGVVDSAALEALGVPSIGGIPLLQLDTPGALWAQWVALYTTVGDVGGFYAYTNDEAQIKKSVGFGSKGNATLLSWRHYAAGAFERDEVETLLQSSSAWAPTFENLGNDSWRVTYQQGWILTDTDGAFLSFDVEANGDPVFVDLRGETIGIQVVIDVGLRRDELTMRADVLFQGQRIYEMPYEWRATYDAPMRLFDACARYRAWARGEGPGDLDIADTDGATLEDADGADLALGAVPAHWMQGDPSRGFGMSEKVRDRVRLHVVFGEYPGNYDLPAELASFRESMTRIEDLIGAPAGGGETTVYWQSWHGQNAVEASLEGDRWPDWDPPQEVFEEELAAARAAGQDPGVYILPTLYYPTSRSYEQDGAEDFTLVDIDGEPQTEGSGTYETANRIDQRRAFEALSTRWGAVFGRHGYNVTNIYHDAVSGLPTDAFPDFADGAVRKGGTSEVHDGRRDWLAHVLGVQDGGPFILGDLDDAEITDADSSLLVTPGPFEDAFAVDADGAILTDADGAWIVTRSTPEALLVDIDEATIVDTDAAELTLPSTPFVGGEAYARTENPQESFIGLAQLHGYKSRFVLLFGILPADQAWRWCYGPEAMAMPLVENPIARVTESGGATATTVLADVVVFSLIFQWHAGMLLAINYISTRGNYSLPPLENEWNAAEARIWGKLRELAMIDRNAVVREARMFGRPLRPPAGFFWDAWEDERGFNAALRHLELFYDENDDVIVVLLSNRGDSQNYFHLFLPQNDYPEVVGKTGIYDGVLSDFVDDDGVTWTDTDGAYLVDVRPLLRELNGASIDLSIAVQAGETRALEIW